MNSSRACGIRCALLAALALLSASHDVYAVNRCTIEGRVVYQDSPCPNTASASARVKVWENTPGADRGNQSWSFLRYKDDMTGRVYCRAHSPLVVNRVGGNQLAWLRLMVSVVGSSLHVGVQALDDGPSFHSDLVGMGVKVADQPMVTVESKPNQRTVALKSPDQLIDQLGVGSSFRIRARFWPYDDLFDFGPISNAGFSAALSQARRCAAS